MTESPSESGFESPSLASNGRVRAPAFELKFLLNAALAADIETWSRGFLALDTHGDAALNGAYRTTSLYFDTPALDVYYRSPWYSRRKLRVRRYGQASWTFCERKAKRGSRVIKRRSVVPDHEIPQLAQAASIETWNAHWFHRLLLTRRLQPACRIAYLRTAYVGSCGEGPLRLTLDRDIRGVLAAPDDWRLASCDHGLPLLKDHVILELKYLHALPQPFKELVQRFAINPAIVSKYRACREAWGLPSANGEVACA